jgi:hypothetical protein
MILAVRAYIGFIALMFAAALLAVLIVGPLVWTVTWMALMFTQQQNSCPGTMLLPILFLIFGGFYLLTTAISWIVTLLSLRYGGCIPECNIDFCDFACVRNKWCRIILPTWGMTHAFITGIPVLVVLSINLAAQCSFVKDPQALFGSFVGFWLLNIILEGCNRLTIFYCCCKVDGLPYLHPLDDRTRGEEPIDD